MARNYFKAIGGRLPNDKRLVEEVVFFDDTLRDDAHAALRKVRNLVPFGDVSVWRLAASVPADVPQTGVSVVGDVLQAGQG